MKGYRKMIVAGYILIASTVMVFTGFMEADIYMKTCGIVIGLFSLVNGVEHVRNNHDNG